MTLLIDALTDRDSSVLLCSTERQARDLRSRSAMMRLAEGEGAWINNQEIMVLPMWQREQFLSLLHDKQLLHPAQELAIVKQVIDASGLLPPIMLSSMSVARKVHKAYGFLHSHLLERDRESYLFSAEYEAFYQWAESVERILDSSNSLMRCQLPAVLSESASELNLPQRVYLSFGLTISPADQLFMEALSESGVEIIKLGEEGSETTPARHSAFATCNDEAAHIASWCAEVLKPFENTPLQAPGLCIAVPDVRAYKPVLEDAFAAHILPEAFSASPESTELPWEFVGCQSLGGYPVVRTALDILMASPTGVGIEQFSRVLRSPYIAAANEERGFRAELDIRLRENSGPVVGFNGLVFLLSSFRGSNEKSSFEKRFLSLCEVRGASSGKRYPSAWVEEYRKWLGIMGWPGELDSLDSETYQIVKALQNSLITFGTLDRQLGKVGADRAAMWLREMVDTQQFQPKRNHLVPIRVMNVEDAKGMHYEYLWIAGMSSDACPAKAEPNPFLPVHIQEKARVPGASPDVVLEQAADLISGLLRHHESVIASYHLRNDDGSTNCPSPLIAGLISADIEMVKPTPIWGKRVELMFPDSDPIPTAEAEEVESLRGGVSILKNFALQPFYAFAANRLRINPFPDVVVGFDHRVQGNAAHDVLEVFWREHKTSDALHDLISNDSLREAVETCVDIVFENSVDLAEWRHGKNMTALEYIRVADLAEEWLRYEALRTDPFTVVGVETPFECRVEGLKLRVRLDRIDEVSVGDKPHTLIIDYKTSASLQASHLNASNLLEPQLPIYSIYADPKKHGLANFDGVCLAVLVSKGVNAHVRSNWIGSLVPKSRRQTGAVDSDEAWSAQKAAWDKTITDDARSFISGDAAFDYTKKVSRYMTHLKPMLRITENSDRLRVAAGASDTE